MKPASTIDARIDLRTLGVRLIVAIVGVTAVGVVSGATEIIWLAAQRRDIQRTAERSRLTEESARAATLAAELAGDDVNAARVAEAELPGVVNQIQTTAALLFTSGGSRTTHDESAQRHLNELTAAIHRLMERTQAAAGKDRVAASLRAVTSSEANARAAIGAGIHELALRAESYTTKVIWVALAGAVCIACVAAAMAAFVLRPAARTLERIVDDSIRARESALDTVQQREQLLIKVSRDVRTPMMSVLGYSDMLLEPTLSAAQRSEIVGHIRRSTRHLLALVHDILDHAAAGSGRLSVKKIPCSPEQLLREVVAMVRPLASKKQLRLSEQVDATMPVGILSDPHRLSQVLFSLIGNAIKFTSNGEIVVRATVDASNSERLVFEVRDTGKGMTSDQLRAYGLLGSHESTPTAPATMGLSLAVQLARLLGGAISAQSSPGSGSVFRLEIPNEPATLPTVAARGKDVAMFPCLTGNVLVAEDSTDSQKLIAFYLRKLGLESTLASDGKKAIDAAVQAVQIGNPFDMILMDMQMPELDGYEATRQLRAQGYKGAIVALTGNALSGDREKCLEAGCNDYLTKPIEREVFIATCTRLLSRPDEPDLRLAA
jgi:signal transduction histidine kinase/ActR/RegA family two-component response regulator